MQPKDVINTPVTLEFLGLNERALVTENDLEQSILDNLQHFLLEMGHGFCFEAEVMQPDDNPPIGILLCTEKGDTLVKYATAGLDPNIFVQKYMIELPSEEEIKAFISSSNC